MTTSDARQQLIDHIKRDAVFHGDFTLTSGKKASYYVDLRRVSLDHRVHGARVRQLRLAHARPRGGDRPQRPLAVRGQRGVGVGLVDEPMLRT